MQHQPSRASHKSLLLDVYDQTLTNQHEMDHSKALSDELLLLIFAKPPLDALLEARAVCCRWRDLALDPNVCRHRKIQFNLLSSNLKEYLLALRVARRLRSLSISVDYSFFQRSEPDDRGLRAARRMKCTVSELRLLFPDARDLHVDKFRGRVTAREIKRMGSIMRQVLRRNLELQVRHVNTLRKVELTNLPYDNTLSLVELALRAPNLTELELYHGKTYIGESYIPITSIDSDAILSDEAALGNASLRKLRYDSSLTELEEVMGKHLIIRKPPLVLQPLLRAHAATLESLTVLSQWFGGEEELLASCPQLRRLELGVFYGNSKVLNALPSAQITDLTLFIGRVEIAEFVPFFRDNGTHITRLSLYELNSGQCHIINDDVLAVLNALVESNRSCLQELSIGELRSLKWGWWTSLFDVLRGLPRLRSLSLDVRDREDDLSHFGDLQQVPLLPNLQVLNVSAWCVQLKGAWQKEAWCGLPALHRLVRHNPQLHVVGLPSEHGCPIRIGHNHFDKVKCGCCMNGLHLPDLAAEGHYSLCGHGEDDEQCSLQAHRTRSRKCPCSPECECFHTWIQIPN